MIVLDTSFSFEAIESRGLKNSVTCRDLDGYFEHVWSVHPFASLVTSNKWGKKFGLHVTYLVNAKHTFIEGKVGVSNIIRIIPALNFLLSQILILFFLIRLIKREKIDVVRVGDALYLGLLGVILKKFTDIKLVVRVGANNQKIREVTGRLIMPRLFRSEKQERLIEHFVLSRADLIAGANKENIQFAINSGANPDKCTIFRYGNLIDPSHFLPPSQRATVNESFTRSPFLLCIARLEPVKKIDDVIRVLAEVKNCGFDVKVLLVGEGSERDNLTHLADQLGVLNDVVFCGNRDQQWLASIIPIAKVILSPHTGRALTEAALAAAPIAAYDVDWQAELIETGITGELVSFGDWRALAISTIKLLRDRAYALNVGDKLRSRALEMMNPKKLNCHEKFEYEKLLISKL